ncbi:unnamed protein product [Calypogeia fissa]
MEHGRMIWASLRPRSVFVRLFRSGVERASCSSWTIMLYETRLRELFVQRQQTGDPRPHCPQPAQTLETQVATTGRTGTRDPGVHRTVTLRLGALVAFTLFFFLNFIEGA